MIFKLETLNDFETVLWKTTVKKHNVKNSKGLNRLTAAVQCKMSKRFRTHIIKFECPHCTLYCADVRCKNRICLKSAVQTVKLSFVFNLKLYNTGFSLFNFKIIIYLFIKI